jgi:hypothetical protein
MAPRCRSGRKTSTPYTAASGRGSSTPWPGWARMKEYKILRDYRRAASTLTDTAAGIAHLYNIITTG